MYDAKKFYYNNLKKTYTDDVVKWVDANVANEKYQVKNGREQLFKDALKEFNKGKSTSKKISTRI